ncbi:hypothetical protein GN956_G5282 [Arapaima gigas]
MTSVNPLTPQNRTKNDVSTKAARAAKCCKPPSADQLSRPRDENRDPNARMRSTTDRCAGVSRLPVPIRSQKLRNQQNLCRTQKTLEEISKNIVPKQPCTKAVHFSCSQMQAIKTTGGNQEEALVCMKPEALPSASLAARCPARLLSAKPHDLAQCSKPPAVSKPVNSAASIPTPELSKSAPVKTVHPVQDSSQSVSRGGAGSVPSSQINPTAQGAASSDQNSGNAVQFCPDPAALHSILQNEGVKTRVPAIMASTLMNDIQSPSVLGSGVQFSPDAAALLSILQNKGVQEGESQVATPHGSICPAMRGSSVYLPQRVPVAKNHVGSVGVLPGQCIECIQTPAMRWTPQRVPNTRPQYTRGLLSSHRTPIFRNTPKIKEVQGWTQELKACKEENVVQRLFEDAEQQEELSPFLGLSGQQGRKDKEGNELLEKQVITSLVSAIDGENGEDEKQPKVQPFVQAAHRGSVIVFAQAKKDLSMTGAEEKLQIPQDELGPAPLEPSTSKHELVQMMQEQPKRPFVQAVPAQSLYATGTTLRLTCSASVTSALRHRLQTLGEVLLDEECAMYASSQPSSDTPLYRCVNPVATTLDFRDSTCFVPILPPTLVPLSPSSCDRDATVSDFDLLTEILQRDLTVE